MALVKVFIIKFLVLAFTSTFINATVSQQCLDCICESSSGCDQSKKCHTASNGGYFCGSYQISWPYWSDGGKLGFRGGPHDFETCLNNKACAEATIIGYMNKYATDCNSDGQLSCIDYAMMHVTGRDNCKAGWLEASAYWKAFKRTSCFRDTGVPSLIHSNRREDSGPELGHDGRPSVRGTGSAPRRDPGPALTPVFERPVAADRSDQPSFGPSFMPERRPPPPPSNRRPQPDGLGHRNPVATNAGQPRFVGSRPAFVGRAPASRGRAPVSWNFSNGTSVVVDDTEGILRLIPGAPQPQPGGHSSRGIEPFQPTTFDRQPVPRPRSIDTFQPPNEQPNIVPPPVQPRPQPQPRLANPPNRPQSQPSPSPPANHSPVNGPVTSTCLSCICQASSSCDLSKQCVGDFCGPYLISWQYWSDGGRPGGDYVSCSLNRQCAEQAVQGYMSKWMRDCNGDGLVDCDDFAAIHKLGPHQCRSEAVISTDYWRNYERCSATAGPQPSTSGAGIIESRNLGTRSADGREAESVLSRSESLAPHFPGHSSVDTRSNFFHDRRPAPGVLPFNVPLHDGNFNAISLPFPTKPPALNFSRANFPTTPRPDLPLITPRRNILNQQTFQAFRRGRGRFFGATEKPMIDVTSECLACICEASSGCDLDSKCSEGPDQRTQTCGAYQLDRNYWTAAGSPGYRGASLDFERCSTEKDCAEETVRRFLSKMAFDCNEDGNVDCLDLAAVHKAGPKACNADWFLESKFWNDFQQCYGFGR